MSTGTKNQAVDRKSTLLCQTTPSCHTTPLRL